MSIPALSRRRLSLGVAGAGLLGLSRQSMAQVHDADLSQVTIVVGTPNKTGLHRQLLASGLSEGTPYRIQWADFDSTQPLTEALRAGHVDIAAGGETGVFFAIANGARISILAASVDQKQTGSAILVRKDSPLRSVADLRDRKIALPYYTKQHYQLARALQAAGVPWERRNILQLNTTDGLSALLNGQVDAFAVWDPNTAIAETEHGARILQPLKEVVDVPGLLYAPTRTVEDPLRRRALEDITRRIIRAQVWVNSQPDQWAAEISRLSSVPLPAARLQVARGPAIYEPANTPRYLQAWQNEVEYFRSIDQFRQGFQVADHVAPGFDEVVAAERAVGPTNG